VGQGKNASSNGNGKNSSGGGDSGKRRFKRRFKFIEPWPENKPYTSKSGNSLSRECEDYLKNCCFRCGVDSHKADKCRIYTDRTVIITLCTECRQGFHYQCKNYRKVAKPDQKAITNQVQAPLSLEHISAQIKADLEDIIGRPRPFTVMGKDLLKASQLLLMGLL
jgi:hypothetical protein